MEDPSRRLTAGGCVTPASVVGVSKSFYAKVISELCFAYHLG